MICSSKETAEYMVTELNEERFMNIPCFFGINCRAKYWMYKRLNEYYGSAPFVVWVDMIHSHVYTKKPNAISTKQVVLHHHYAGSIGS